jgi:hypothetical protein
MTAVILDSTAHPAPIDVVYPSSDGEPCVESYDPLYVIMTILAMLGSSERSTGHSPRRS